MATMVWMRRRKLLEQLGRTLEIVWKNNGCKIVKGPCCRRIVTQSSMNCFPFKDEEKTTTVIVMDDSGEEEGWIQKMEWNNSNNEQSYNDVWNQVQELKPNTIQEWQDVSDLYWKLGKFQSCWDAQWQHWLLLQQQESVGLLQQAQCMNRLGCIAMQLNDYKESKRWLDQSLKYKQTYYDNTTNIDDDDDTMDCTTIGQTELGKSYNSLALWHLQQQQDNEEEQYALEYLNQAEQEYRFAFSHHSNKEQEQQIMEEYCNICQNLATLHRQYGDYAKALEYYQLALNNIPSSKSNKRLEVQLHLADIYYALERYHEAAEHYEIVLKQKKDNDDDDGSKSIIHLNLGRVHTQSGRYELAMDHYQQALETVVETIQEATIYNAMGALYAVQDDEITALRYFNMALDIYREYNYKTNSYEDEILYTQSNIQRVQHTLFTSSNNNTN